MIKMYNMYILISYTVYLLVNQQLNTISRVVTYSFLYIQILSCTNLFCIDNEQSINNKILV